MLPNRMAGVGDVIENPFTGGSPSPMPAVTRTASRSGPYLVSPLIHEGRLGVSSEGTGGVRPARIHSTIAVHVLTADAIQWR
jgi:hypothetical protein